MQGIAEADEERQKHIIILKTNSNAMWVKLMTINFFEKNRVF